MVVFGLSMYIIFAPLWPSATIGLQKDPPLVEQEKIGKQEKIPDKNTLVIPGLKLQQEVLEGGEAELNRGVWRTSTTGTPLKGNMVLSGHRFTYGGPAVFYHLDKVKTGDSIVVFWENKKYNYQVTETFIVKPSQIEILDSTKNQTLTIYTCTPLWTATDRLVIRAVQLEEAL